MPVQIYVDHMSCVSHPKSDKEKPFICSDCDEYGTVMFASRLGYEEPSSDKRVLQHCTKIFRFADFVFRTLMARVRADQMANVETYKCV